MPAYATVSINVLPVNDAPVACATIAEVGYAREVNNFDASCTVDVDSTNLTYQWDFGDGNTAVGQIVTHTYKRRQSYTVSVTVFDGELSTSYSSNIDIVRAPKGSKN